MSDYFSMSLLGRNFRHSVERFYEPLRKEYKLKQVEIEIILLFEDSESISGVNICSALELTKGHVSQAMFDLCFGGYVRADACLTDRRLISYKLTESGKALLTRLTTIRNNLFEALKDELGPDALDNFTSVANSIINKMNASDVRKLSQPERS